MTVVRGVRGYHASFERPDHYEPAARKVMQYVCPNGHTFDVTVAIDAEPPDTWECRKHGIESMVTDVEGVPESGKSPRTHWDMLRERRSIPELEAVLAERLKALRASRFT